MKNAIRKKILIVMQTLVYGISLQILVAGVLIAGPGNAQNTSITEVRLSMDLKNASLAEVFHYIETKTDFVFAYNRGDINKKDFTLDEEEISLYNVLQDIGLEHQLAFRRVGNTIEVARREVKSKVVKEKPTVVVTGTVTDETGEGLPGVNVQVKGTTMGTVTDASGAYSIDVPGGSVLIFSFVGYQTKEVVVGNQSVIDITMTLDVQALSEVVVVGYGTQRKASLTGAVESIGGRELAEQPEVQTSAALMGKVPGMQILQESGQPGRNQATIRIRGVGTLNDNNAGPLVLIDGVPGDINDIPSSDVENISVLKDASSAAIYGSRASNGVILVTTRRGGAGTVSFNYNSNYMWKSAVDQPEFVMGAEYMRLENLALENVGSTPIWLDDFITDWEANNGTDPDNFPNTDWVDEVFNAGGFQQQQSLTARGGSENISYYGALNYDEDNGIIDNYSFKRYSIRLNTDVKLSSRFDLETDINIVRADRTEPTAEFDIPGEAYRIPPLFASQFTHGGWAPALNGFNPVAAVSEGGFDDLEQSIVRGRIKLGGEPVKGLRLDATYAPVYESNFAKEMIKQFEITDPGGDVIGQNPAVNSLEQSFSRDFTHTLNFVGKYDRIFGSHLVTLLGGYEMVDFSRDRFEATRQNFALQDFEQLDAGDPATQENEGTASEWNLQSFFSRLNYSFKDRYLFEASFRYDGSSRFRDGFRWGFFPSVSAGWIISEEDFMSNLTFIDLLKVRASWGELGNQQIGTYPSTTVIDLDVVYLEGGEAVPGSAQRSLANPGITWETTETTNLGVDLAFLDGRLNSTFDYFTRTTKDILLRLPVPLIVGLNPAFQNAGEVENRGWEFAVNWRDQLGNGLEYSVGFNIADVTNEVTDLRGLTPPVNNNENTIIQEGFPIRSIYGFQSDGLFQSQEEIDNHATQFGMLQPGDIRYVDQLTVDTDNDGVPDAGDGVINADDRVVIGDPFPSLNYGINLSARFKGFDLSLFFQGIGDRDVLLRANSSWAFFNGGKITEEQAETYWRPEAPDNDYPRLTHGRTGNNFRESDFWVYSASYLRLRNLQFGYSLPSKILDNTPFRSMRAYFVGQNLFTLFDDMPDGIDPNVPNNTTGGYFVINRIMGFGLSVQF